MRSLPFDRAVELARIAETFVTGSAIETTSHEPVRPAVTPSVNPAEPKESVDQISTSATVPADRPTEPERLPLSDDERDRLLDRLAKGARNAELAAEFGIPAKQVQELRMVALAG